ncbi:MAG: hypothetical protein ACOX5R_09980 [bacterium]
MTFFAHYNQYLFHDTGISPRSMGMGGAYSALRGLEMGNLGNPGCPGMAGILLSSISMVPMPKSPVM